MKSFFKLAICVLIPLLIGVISGITTADNINTWFIYLNKPFFNPPNYLFGPVWTTLYILMGYSLYRILNQPQTTSKKKALIIYSIQLFLNFCWSFLFFKFHLLGLAFCEILLLLSSIIWMIISFYKLDKIASYLNIPYLLWVSFASVLNISFWWLNK